MNLRARQLETECSTPAPEALAGAATRGSRLAWLLRRIASFASARRHERLLHLREMLPLGEKRFVAVVECGREKFLLAGTAQNICLLLRLDGNCERTREERCLLPNPE